MDATRGYFLCHALTVPEISLRFDARHLHARMQRRPAVLRHRQLDDDEQRIWVNELGTVVALQPVHAASWREALTQLAPRDAFLARADAALAGARHVLGRAPDRFDFSVLVRIEGTEHDLFIGEDVVRLPEADSFALEVLVEALMLVEMCRVVESEISQLPRARVQGVSASEFVAHTQALFRLDRPQSVYPRPADATLMDAFYSAWEIPRRIERLKEHLTQTVSEYSFFWEQAERRRDTVMNTLLAVLAVLALLDADASLAEVTDRSELFIDRVILIFAGALLCWLLWTRVWRRWRDVWLPGVRTRRASRRVRARLAPSRRSGRRARAARRGIPRP